MSRVELGCAKRRYAIHTRDGETCAVPDLMREASLRRCRPKLDSVLACQYLKALQVNARTELAAICVGRVDSHRQSRVGGGKKLAES